MISNRAKFSIITVGIACIIGGIISLSVRAWIQSDEGLNIEPDETPIGQSHQFTLNYLLILGIVFIILGIIIIIYSLIG